MSSKDEHYEKVLHNKNFLNSVRTQDFPDWTVVVIFYQAVHLIESILALNEIHTNSHIERGEKMNDDIERYPQEMRRSYRKLEVLSRQARYKPELPITDEMVVSAQNNYDEIKSWYKKMLNE